MSATPKPRDRFGAIYFPHGATMARWTPKDEGRDFTFSEILQPLEPYRAHINVITNLGHPLAYGPGGATGNHNRSSAAFLSGANAASGAQPRLGITVDQVAAKQMGQDTPLPSLELTIEEASLSCGEGLSCAYRNTMSWQGETSPLPMQNNPQVVFEQLFGDGANDAQRAARRSQSLSLLDSVTEQIRGARPHAARVGPRAPGPLRDRRARDRAAHQAVRRARGQPRHAARPADRHPGRRGRAHQADVRPAGAGLADGDHAHQHVHAGEGAEQRGVPEERHPRFVPHPVASLEQREQQGALRGAEPLSRRRCSLTSSRSSSKLPDGDGTLLDHSLVLYGSGMSDGNSHNHDPLPIVLAGRAGGALQGNRHIRQKELTPMSNLLLAILDKLGCPEEHFGDSTAPLAI